MTAKALIDNLSYNLPDSITKKINLSSNLSEQLSIIRNWVHTNNNINHEKRLEWHKPILAIAKKEKLLDIQAASLTNIAKIHDRLGQFDKSLQSIKQAQNIFIELSSNDSKYINNLIISYCDQAVTLRLQNHLEEALSVLHKGYNLFKKNESSSEQTQIILFSDLGTIYKQLTDYPAALNAFDESLSLIKKSKNRKEFIENEILCHINLGNVLRDSEKINDASKEYTKAMRLLDDNKDYQQFYIITHINLGQTLVDLKNFKRAIRVYDKALEECSQSGGDLDLGFIYILMADAHFNLKDMEAFDIYIKKGEKLVKNSAYPPDLLFLNSLRAKKYTLEKNYKTATSLLLESIDICKKNNMDRHLLRSYKAIIDIYKEADDTKNAFKFSEKYIKHRDITDKKFHQIFLNEKQQSLNRMKQEIKQIKDDEYKKNIEAELNFKKRELISKKLHSLSSRDFLELLYKILKDEPKSENLKVVLKECQSQLALTSSWNDFLSTYEQTDPEFMNSLMALADTLSPTEIRVCTLVRLGLDSYEMASFMSVSKRSIEQHRYRIKKKLKIDVNLTEHLLSI